MIKKPILGIMVCKMKRKLFNEQSYYRLLQKFGEKKNLFVIVFYPTQIDWAKNQVRGFRYNFSLKKWESGLFPLPNYIFDRCFYTSSELYRQYKPYVEKLKKQQQIEFLGIGLKGKWQVHQILSQDPELKQYLLKTAPFNIKVLSKWINIHPVIIKPTGGSHGVGVIRIANNNKLFVVTGRGAKNELISTKFKDLNTLIKWVRAFVKGKRYLIQQYADLTTANKEPFDIRVLVQKNNLGNWETTGMAARVGKRLTLTSNLHGGGGVQTVESILTQEFGIKKTEQLLEQISMLAKKVPTYIESSHGKLFEVGLDIGIDRQGNVWIIEVNSKPGRQVFSLLRDNERRKKALLQPVFYTLYLTQRQRTL